MRRTLIATTAAVALLAATAGSAVAGAPGDHPKASYGKGVQVHCGAPFGQLVQAAKKNPDHPSINGIGARKFITLMAALATSEDPEEQAIAIAHGCFVPEPED
jgi:hypothetical protein